MSALQKSMEDLTAQWYNALVTGLGLDPTEFQLFQGTNVAGNTIDWIAKMFDQIPPDRINNYFHSGGTKFSSLYQTLLSVQLPNPGNPLQKCLGSNYMNWMSHLQANPPKTFDQKSYTNAFQQWAIATPGVNSGCVSNVAKMFTDPLLKAQVRINDADTAGKGLVWDASDTDLQNAIISGAAKSFQLDSATTSTSTSACWASGGTSVMYDLFSFGAQAATQKESQAVFKSGLSISGKFDKVATLTASPFETPNPTDPILSQYEPWYDSAIVARAKATPNHTVWQAGATPNWNSVFGAKGSMKRKVTGLIIVDGFSATLSSKNAIAKADQAQVQAAAKGGIWPFFSANAAAGASTTATFDGNGALQVKISSPQGNPMVLGMLVGDV